MSQTRHPELGFHASLEIIQDIFFLSRCSTLVGIAASQIYRMSVSLANVTGILKYSVAIDYDQIPRIRAMSKMYGVIYVDNFEMP